MKNQRSSQPIAADNVLKLAKGFGKIQEYGPKPPPADALRFVYPMFNDQAFSQMMDGYRRHVDEYNMITEWENVDIHNHNQNVEIYLKNKATEIQKGYAKSFPKLNEELIRPRDYNAAAASACEKYGPIIKKRPVPTIKPVTEQVFQNFLHVYNCQLAAHNDEAIRFSRKTPRPLPPMKVNSLFITQLRRAEGMFSLKVCSKTVRTHRQRLEEAGVFVNSNFRGWQMAVEVEINPSILAVFDDHTKKLTSPENQSVTPETWKTLPDINETTGTFKEEYKEKNDASQSLVDKVSPQATTFEHMGSLHMNTGSNLENSPVAAPARVLNKPKSLSQQLLQQIMHPQELAEALARGELDEYVPIPIGIMKKVAYDGTLTADQYRELFIQECFKQAAKIWIGRTPYPGSWKKAINLWYKYKFLTFNGNSMSPTNLFDYVTEFRWRIEQARRWFLRPNVKVSSLYPSDYFDPTRKNPNELAFEGTAKMWKRKLEYDNKKPIEKLQLDKIAKARQKRLSDNDRFNREINRHLKGRTTQEQLSEYVRVNLPEEFSRELPKVLHKKSAEANNEYSPT